MKKIILELILFSVIFFSSCIQKSLVDDSNISEYENFVNRFSIDKNADVISRDPENSSLILVSKFDGGRMKADKSYASIFGNNKTLGRIFKFEIDLDCVEDSVTDLQKKYMSESALEREYGIRLLRKRIDADKKMVSLICIQEYRNNFFTGFCLDSNEYVYSADLDLSKLTSEELRVFGFAFANKTKFKNWFYTGPLG